MMTIEYDIQFESDFHIGSGFGIPGIADNLIVKDATGVPYIPGTTIKAMLRDSAETVCDLLEIPRCDGEPGTNDDGSQKTLCGVTQLDNVCPICIIFGSRFTPASFAFESARYEEDFQKVVHSRSLRPIIRSLTRTETHNRIDRWTGTAQKDFLFTHELGIHDHPFSGRIVQVMALKNELLEGSENLLSIALNFTERIGGKRRRGKGKCAFLIDQTQKPDCALAETWIRSVQNNFSPKAE